MQTPDQAKAQLDAHVREIIQWHFSPETGCPFWLDWAKKAVWIPRKEIKSFADMQKFPHFQDEWLRDLQPEVWVPAQFKASRSTSSKPAAPPACPSSASAGTITKSITASSREKISDEHFPRNHYWLMMGPTGPRRLRLAIEHLANVRGSSCYFIDLDPRWVKKLISAKTFRSGPRLHGSRRRPGRDDPEAPQSQRPVHHAETPRSARRKSRSLGRRHPRRLLRRHHHGPAIRALHRRRSSRKPHRLLSHLRQHAHGPRRQRAAEAGG